MMGVPTDADHNMSGRNQLDFDTEHERQQEEALLEESKIGDIQLLAMRDQYEVLSYKTISLFDYGLQTHAPYIMAHDDDFCANVEYLEEVLRSHEANDAGSYLYTGFHEVVRPEGEAAVAQAGPKGYVAKYFEGSGYLLQRELAELIMVQDHSHTVLNGIYGTTSEDVNMGKWVRYASEQHGVNISYQEKRGIISKLGPDGSWLKKWVSGGDWV